MAKAHDLPDPEKPARHFPRTPFQRKKKREDVFEALERVTEVKNSKLQLAEFIRQFVLEPVVDAVNSKAETAIYNIHVEADGEHIIGSFPASLRVTSYTAVYEDGTDAAWTVSFKRGGTVETLPIQIKSTDTTHNTMTVVVADYDDTPGVIVLRGRLL